MNTYKDIDHYISCFPPEIQQLLLEVRNTIHETAPEAKEVISYQMPAFKMKRVLVYFAANKKHIGFYPTASGISNFIPDFEGYSYSKGCVQFPLDRPLPLDLIKKIVAFRVKEDQGK